MRNIKIFGFSKVLVLAVMVLSCTSWQQNYGSLRMLPENRDVMGIQDLIDNWDRFDIYYSDHYDGFNPQATLGIMFDPKDGDTTLVGDRWKKVSDQKTLIEMTKWIFPTTGYEPWLNEILGPNGELYGYLYYSYGIVILKMIGDKTMYVFNLEHPYEEGDGEPQN